ncbi:MAG TPA: hypothetical protein VF618_06385 [Thermoanaerobaculia bacterium]
MRRVLFAALLFAATTTFAQTIPPPPYQEVLVPLSVPDLPGANGSVWRTDLWAVNGSTSTASVAALPCIVVSPGPTFCAGAIAIPPNRTVQLPPLGGTAAAPGVLLRVSTLHAESTAFTLHVRDVTRNGESWGTEIPVLRMRDLFLRPVHLTSIPFGSDYRQTLRLYAILPGGGSTARFRVKLYDVNANADRMLRDEVVTLELPPTPPPNAIGTSLAQATVTDLFHIEIGGVDRVRVTIEPVTDPLAFAAPVPFWAFVSVTNNKTQQVTTVTPR